MRPKEINAIIQEQTEEFFKQEGFKYVKKSIGYVKKTKDYYINYGFVHYEYHPEYEYATTLFVQLTKVEEIFSKIDGTGILGNTFVFKLSYFLGIEYWINNNPEWNIEYKEDIPAFSKALIDAYTKYIKDFIPFITQPQNMLNFLLEQIVSDKIYTNVNVWMRALILLKILDDPRLSEKYIEFKEKLKAYNDNDQIIYGKQMDDVVAGNW